MVLLPTVPSGIRFFDFAELLLHLRIDFPADFAASGSEEGEDRYVFGEVVADGAAGIGHRTHAEPIRDAVLDRQADLAERSERARAAAEHSDKYAALAPAQSLDMTAEFVYPHGDLVTVSSRNGMLPMRAPGESGILGGFG